LTPKDPVQVPVVPTPAPSLQIGGILAIDKEDLLRKLMTPKVKPQILEEGKHLIVIDGPNVATVTRYLKIKILTKKKETWKRSRIQH
jgi:hypothetical protein